MNQSAFMAVVYNGSPVASSSSSTDSFIQSLTSWGILIFLVGLILVILVITYVVRVWMVQTAIFQIQSDLSEMKELTIAHISNLETTNSLLIQTDAKNDDIEDEKPNILVNVANGFNGLKKPSKAFLWILGIVVTVFIALIAFALFINR